MGYRLGIDVGGTFTDLVLFSEEAGTLVVEKVPSVPSDPSEGIMDGVARILAGAGVAPKDVVYVALGTTVATNTLLQRHGARTALITTRGFRDLLEIARQRRPSLYDLDVPKPRALVRRKLRRETPSGGSAAPSGNSGEGSRRDASSSRLRHRCRPSAPGRPAALSCP